LDLSLKESISLFGFTAKALGVLITGLAFLFSHIFTGVEKEKLFVHIYR